MKVWVSSVAAAALALAALPASAAVITQQFTFTATDFGAYAGPTPAPIDPVIGVVLITYDPDVAQAPTSVGVDIVSLNLSHTAVNFTYTLAGDGVLDIGSHVNAGGGFMVSQPGDYGVSIFNVRTTPRLGYVQYMTEGGNYYSLNGELSVAEVPEPATWTLMLAGFGLAGAKLRSRRGRTASL